MGTTRMALICGTEIPQEPLEASDPARMGPAVTLPRDSLVVRNGETQALDLPRGAVATCNGAAVSNLDHHHVDRKSVWMLNFVLSSRLLRCWPKLGQLPVPLIGHLKSFDLKLKEPQWLISSMLFNLRNPRNPLQSWDILFGGL